MTTYKEALQQSLETFKTDEIEYDDPVTGEHIKQESRDALPICFNQFIMNMCSILIRVADDLFDLDVGDIQFGSGEKIFEGRPIEQPKAIDYASVFSGADLPRCVMLLFKSQGFIEWLINQEVKDDDIEKMWYYESELVDKWNEFVNQKIAEAEGDD